ncbi:MAG TPA: energy-coupling factor ABC transporter permease [Methanobacterium sp.]|nr:energy-coupling factor ABC transporter permease [Methanobacterium sp.]
MVLGHSLTLWQIYPQLKPIGKVPAIAIASWLSIFLAAEAVAVEMWLAGTFPLDLGLIFMGLYHSVIGVIEAILTVVVILGLESVRPDLLAWNRKKDVGDVKSESMEAAAK